MVLLYFTGFVWLDSAVALVFALMIIVTGYRILRSSIAGIMDEADLSLIREVVDFLNEHREENWIDIHNLRIIQYGSVLHMDFHLSVPWYLNVREAHRELDRIEQLIRSRFGESVELFIHTDACKEFSCRICSKKDCNVRQHPFEKRVTWNAENIASNNRHRIADAYAAGQQTGHTAEERD